MSAREDGDSLSEESSPEPSQRQERPFQRSTLTLVRFAATWAVIAVLAAAVVILLIQLVK